MALADLRSSRPKLNVRRFLAFVPLFALAACGGQARGGAIKIEGPSLPPLQRVPIRTLEPAPSETATPSPAPSATATAIPSPTGTPIPPPAGASMTSKAGTQNGSPSSYCWSDQEGGPSKCYTNDQQSPSAALAVKSGEKVVLKIQALIPPDQESVRPFQGTRSGYPSSQIDPALQTDLTVNLPEGKWSMDLCATWHSRGQPICWLFSLNVAGKA
ncbi:MAG: hypothetical protein QOJ29_1014 [Thermoleophilaceae bacterium]|jgi:FtsP/CotA-like multicopper oxidase with cupredoxin domain|nr:hypothetical protein [Thermoleophilaceae bacterium]